MSHTLYITFEDLLGLESSYGSRSKGVVRVGPEEKQQSLPWQPPLGGC